MKIVGTMGSIRKGDNKIISATFSDWSAIREGTFIKFNNDSQFYIAAHSEKRTYLKDFIVLESSVIKINEDCGVNINEGDTLYISYKEYELSTIYKIISAGKGYKIGDQLTLSGGVPSLNITDNTLNSTKFIVSKIGEEGEIGELDIINRGKYIDAPSQITDLKGGLGSLASLEVGFKLTDHRSFIERDVQKIEFKSAATIINLMYSLPGGIKEGKLSIEKWEIILSSNYQGENRIAAPFQITRDFTPNYKIPLITKNSLNQELIVNHALTLLDKKIMELENQIKELKNGKN